jgi:hypothetical protein
MSIKYFDFDELWKREPALGDKIIGWPDTKENFFDFIGVESQEELETIQGNDLQNFKLPIRGQYSYRIAMEHRNEQCHWTWKTTEPGEFWEQGAMFSGSSYTIHLAACRALLGMWELVVYRRPRPNP